MSLARSRNDRIIGGVCGGLGHYLGIDSTLVRLFFVIAVFFGFGTAALIYLILWIAMPLDEADTAVPAQPKALLPEPMQDPTGEWKFDPYTGEQLRKGESSNQ